MKNALYLFVVSAYSRLNFKSYQFESYENDTIKPVRRQFYQQLVKNSRSIYFFVRSHLFSPLHVKSRLPQLNPK